jgi:hypothetical protein
VFSGNSWYMIITLNSEVINMSEKTMHTYVCPSLLTLKGNKLIDEVNSLLRSACDNDRANGRESVLPVRIEVAPDMVLCIGDHKFDGKTVVV